MEVINIKNLMKSDRKKVRDFLENLHNILNDDNFDIDKNFILIRSSKNKKNKFTTIYALTDLEYEISDVVERLKELTIEDYSETLFDRDDSNPPLLFVFGKTIENRLVYIKIKNKEKSEGKKVALCVSFHYAEKDMKFPYKKCRDTQKRRGRC